MPLNDAMFLMAEKREQPMHVGGLQLFDLPPGAGEDWLRELYRHTITSTDIAPLYRKRPYRPATSLGAWSWQIDHDVDLEHHVRHSALPKPGRVRELLELVSRLHGTLLDRHRPLWEAHLIEGLDGNRFGVYTKMHHSLMDGVSALRLLAYSLSTDPDERDMPTPWSVRPPRRSSSQEEPGGLQSLLGVPLSALRRVGEVAGLGPRAGKAAVKALLASNSHLPSLAPKTVLNQPITGARRYAAQSWALERMKEVAKASDATLNDVLLAMSAAALRDYLTDMDALPEQPLVAMTPVSLREAGSDFGGNSVGALLANLATDIADPAARLAAIHESMESGKASLRSMSPTQVTVVSAAAMSPMILGMLPGVWRVANPAYNIVISNIPGPTDPLYWNGARLRGVYPLSIPTDGQALNITATSYAGQLDIGLTGCRRTVPHLQRMLTYMERGLTDLERAVIGSPSPAPASSPSRAAKAPARRQNGTTRPRAKAPTGTPGRRGR